MKYYILLITIGFLTGVFFDHIPAYLFVFIIAGLVYLSLKACEYTIQRGFE